MAALARLLDQTMNDIQSMDSEFEERLVRTVQETEASVERLAEERTQRALADAERNMRASITEELQARFERQVSDAVSAVRNELSEEQMQLKTELQVLRESAATWERERSQLVSDGEKNRQLLEQASEDLQRITVETDEAAVIALERQVSSAVERVRAEAAAKWEAERTELFAQRDRAVEALADRDAEHHQAIEVMDRVRSELTEERDRLRQRLDQVLNASAQIESERNRLRDECQQSRRLLAQANSEQARLQAELEQTGAPAVSSGGKSAIDVDALHTEVDRVERLIQSMSRLIEDPGTELSIVIRKNAERAELESYLRGIRFSIPKRGN
jgi:hypothetical protein